MKKIFILGAALVLMAGCADLSKYTAVDSNASAKTRMRACLSLIHISEPTRH